MNGRHSESHTREVLEGLGKGGYKVPRQRTTERLLRRDKEGSRNIRDTSHEPVKGWPSWVRGHSPSPRSTPDPDPRDLSNPLDHVISQRLSRKKSRRDPILPSSLESPSSFIKPTTDVGQPRIGFGVTKRDVPKNR